MYILKEEVAAKKICPVIPNSETCRTLDCIAWIKWHGEEWERESTKDSGYCSLIHNRN